MIEAYPLHYPVGWKRTPKRERSRFNTNFASSRDEIVNELRLMGARNIIISSNVPVKKDGFPYASFTRVSDSGVAVYFMYKEKQQCIPCDRWDDVKDNIHAIALTIKSLRGIERWGAKDMMEATFMGFQALPDYSQSSYFSSCKTEEERREKYIKLCKELHPDRNGGNIEKFIEMKRQYESFRPS